MPCDLVIPAFNEAPNIEALFEALQPLRGELLRHIVLADNGSTDGTPEAAARHDAIVVHEPRRGYGSACLKALDWIGALDKPPDIVAFLDADLSDDPAALPSVIAPIRKGRADLVIGSRVKLADPGALNFVQRFGNGLACRLMHLTTGRRYHDLGPMRAVRFETLQRLNMTDTTWGWTVEMQAKAALSGVRTLEVDVPYRRRTGGRSKISGTVRGVVTAGTKIIVTIFAVRLKHRVARPSER
ncbi:MAG: glycosyltransferase family 2 protein [Planctomycetota bacterium]|nr:MAG: glycosyltransferase family 2 protein [Planctomycetota bacterium]